MNEAISAYRTITASPEYREMERLREKAKHDEAQALHAAEIRANAKVAQRLIRMGLPTQQVVEATELTPQEVESIRRSYLS